MKKGIFITGTNTHIGKTTTAAMMMVAAHMQGMNLHYFKPVQTGDVCDCATVKALTQLSPSHIIQPVYSFALPQAPYRAALAENKSLDMDTVIKHWQQLPDSCYLVEGAGGLLVPLTARQTIRDLVQALALPLVIIASTQLGTINHTLLTVEAALAAGITIKGLILAGAVDNGLVETLQQFTRLPVFCQIPVLNHNHTAHFREIALNVFKPDLLTSILA